MKTWHAVVLAVLIISLPLLSGCDILGIGNKAQKEQNYYQQQLKTYQQVQEANRKAQEAYNEALKKGLEEYLKSYQEYQQSVQQQQIQQIEEAAGYTPTVNQTPPEGGGQ